MKTINVESLGYKNAHLKGLPDVPINTTVKISQGFCGTLPIASSSSSLAPKPTKQEMLDRISVLSDEMDANDQENMMMQEEINSLYAKIDAQT
ncbi:MAG: hypothetical protein Q7K26_01415 [bacterium]|nr:hypothetical protein [bacterium]